LLHLQRDLQQKRLRRDGATFFSPPKGILSKYSPIRGHAVAPNNKRRESGGQAQNARCRAVPFVTASPGSPQIPVTPR